MGVAVAVVLVLVLAQVLVAVANAATRHLKKLLGVPVPDLLEQPALHPQGVFSAWKLSGFKGFTREEGGRVFWGSRGFQASRASGSGTHSRTSQPRRLVRNR